MRPMKAPKPPLCSMVAAGPDSAWEWGGGARGGGAAIYYMLVAGEADNHPHEGVVSRVSVSLYLSYADAVGVCRVSFPTPLCPSALAVDRPHWPFAPPHTKPAGQRGNKRSSSSVVLPSVVSSLSTILADYPRRAQRPFASAPSLPVSCYRRPCQILVLHSGANPRDRSDNGTTTPATPTNPPVLGTWPF